MKTNRKFLLASLFGLGCAFSLGFNAARADDGVEGGDDVIGNEGLEIEMAMTPTAAAPAGSSIQVSLDAEDDNGTTATELKFETQALPDGAYNVTATLKSDGSTVAIGTFNLGSGESETEFKTEDGTFPSNVNPFDIATVSVLDATNVVLFTADLTSATAAAAMTRNATVQATAGVANPSAAGDAMLNAFVSQGSIKGAIQLNGHGLNPSMPLTVTVNGMAVKNAKSDKLGNVSVRLTPKGKTGTVAPNVNLFRVKSVSLNSKAGNVVLNASF